MKQEEKELLIKDLCGRLPYGVKAHVKNWSGLIMEWIENDYVVKSVFPSLNEVHVQSESGSLNVILGYDDYEIQPYLFPLSSMTEEQQKEANIFDDMDLDILSENLDRNRRNKTNIPTPTFNYTDWLNKNHFDYRGLIEKGLAIDATGLNIY